jgi:hypothetical protein
VTTFPTTNLESTKSTLFSFWRGDEVLTSSTPPGNHDQNSSLAPVVSAYEEEKNKTEVLFSDDDDDHTEESATGSVSRQSHFGTVESVVEASSRPMGSISTGLHHKQLSESCCHFEDGNGHYEVINGTWSWNWIHNSSASSSGSNKTCSVSHHLDALLHDRYNHSTPLHIITLGDSLDRNIVLNWICGESVDYKNYGYELYLRRSKEEDERFPLGTTTNRDSENSYNVAPRGNMSSGICTNQKTSFAFLKIYGMHHGCTNHDVMQSEESRFFNTTAERVEKILDFEILSRLSTNRSNSNFVVMVGSALWDLSPGCNSWPGISDKYKNMYRSGVLKLHATIRKLLPDAPVYWKTSPAVSMSYDEQNTLKGYGRTRANQLQLNAILRETVLENNLGIVVDWWELSNRRPETERGISYDGVHYSRQPSITFYNMFLSAVLDHHPEFLI